MNAHSRSKMLDVDAAHRCHHSLQLLHIDCGNCLKRGLYDVLQLSMNSNYFLSMSNTREILSTQMKHIDKINFWFVVTFLNILLFLLLISKILI